MPSSESKQIRATFAAATETAEPPLEIQRKSWEEALESTNRFLTANITPVNINNLSAEWVVTEEPQKVSKKAILYLHGGGYNAGSSITHRALAALVSQASGVPILVINYRLAPEDPFPAAVEDTVTAYRWLLQTNFDPGSIIFGGDSAGAGLAMAAILKLREETVPLPKATFLISPWLDLALTGASIETHVSLDPVVTPQALRQAAQYYAGKNDLKNPLISPLFASMHSLPPLLIQVGQHEVLLDDARRFAEKAQAAGGEVQLEVWDGMWHVWHAWAPALPEASAAINRIGTFVRQNFGLTPH